MSYQRSRKKTDEVIRSSGIVVVMNKDHIKKPEDMIVTMQEVYASGYGAEVTFRIEEGILREGMQQLTRIRATSPAERPMVLGVGSVINPVELEAILVMSLALQGVFEAGTKGRPVEVLVINPKWRSPGGTGNCGSERRGRVDADRDGRRRLSQR